MLDAKRDDDAETEKGSGVFQLKDPPISSAERTPEPLLKYCLNSADFVKLRAVLLISIKNLQCHG